MGEVPLYTLPLETCSQEVICHVQMIMKISRLYQPVRQLYKRNYSVRQPALAAVVVSVAHVHPQVFNLRTTASQKCEAVPRRARMQGA